MILLLTLNTWNFCYYNFERIGISQKSRLELENLAAVSNLHQVKIHLNGGEYMQGFLFNLMDANVDYTIDPQMEKGTTIFNWRINYEVIQ